MLRAECGLLARYVDLQCSVDRVRIADLQHHSISLNLTTPFLRPNGRVPALVAVEVEPRGGRAARRADEVYGG